MKTQNRGFVLLELMISLAVAAILCLTFTVQYFNNIKIESARANAVLHNSFAIAYSQYIQNNYTNLESMALATSPVVIPYSTLISSGYINSNVSMTPNGFTPCALIVLDSASSTLYPLIIDVASSNIQSGVDSVNGETYLGPYAGVYNNSAIYSYSGWSIPNTVSSSYFANNALSKCDFPRVVSNSIVTNLIMAPFFNQYTSDVSLNRTFDSSSIDPQNKNVLKTNISMANSPSGSSYSYNKLAFNISKSTSCVFNSSGAMTNMVSCRTSNVLASSFIAESTAVIGQACNVSTIGNIVSAVTTPSTPALDASTLVCHYNPVMCTLVNGSQQSFCYLPTRSSTNIYTFPATGATARSNYTCPTTTPIAINASAYSQQVTFGLTLTNAGSSTAIVSMPTNNANTAMITGDQGTTSLLVPSNVVTSVGTFPINRSAQVNKVTLPNNINNAARCSQFCNAIVNTSTSVTKTINAAICACSYPPTTQVLNILSYSLTGSGISNSNNLASVTCTNKTVIGPP